jgi:hypothetical protein
MGQIRAGLRFVFNSFGPFVVFYTANHFWGLKQAILLSTLFAIAEIVYKVKKKQPLTSLFKFSAALTLIASTP